jgi:hypothetical protein
MSSIRFLVEDFVEFPLWLNDPGDDRDPTDMRAQLPLSEALRQQLSALSAEYTQRDLSSLSVDEQAAWYLRFDQRSHALAVVVAEELRGAFEVEFKPITAEFSSSLRGRA